VNVLVLFERSGIVREAFRKRGHEAYSCDIKSAEDGSSNHFQMDMNDFGSRHALRLDAQDHHWDVLIAHPECTHLSVSGAHRFKEKQADGRQQFAIDQFMQVANLPMKRLCVENPVGIMSTLWRKPDQIVQPYQFGDDASKKTCLWLRGLPKLTIDPAKYVWPRYVCKGCGAHSTYGIQMTGCTHCRSHAARPRWSNQTDSGQNRLGPSQHRAMDRARTYSGIANAMAEQWGSLKAPQ